jgi:hypothetical protein
VGLKAEGKIPQLFLCQPDLINVAGKTGLQGMYQVAFWD